MLRSPRSEHLYCKTTLCLQKLQIFKLVMLDLNKHGYSKNIFMIKEFRDIFERLAAQLSDDTLTDEECCKYAQEIRSFRKPLCQKYATFF